MASLTLVSLGAVTDGVTLYFSSTKLMTLFWSSPSKWRPSLVIVTTLHPLSAFHLIVCPVFFVNSAPQNQAFIRVSPPGWCRGGSPLVTPLKSWHLQTAPESSNGTLTLDGINHSPKRCFEYSVWEAVVAQTKWQTVPRPPENAKLCCAIDVCTLGDWDTSIWYRS